jgi:cation transport ATPase
MLSDVSIRRFLIGFPVAGIVLGFALRFAGFKPWVSWVWAGSTVPVLLALLVEIMLALRHGEVGLDIVAALSMAAALVFGQELAAAIVALMYAGGQYLEAFAERHARREMTALLARVPRTTLRHRDGKLDEIRIEAVAVGDRLLIRQGDVVPVDGTVTGGLAVIVPAIEIARRAKFVALESVYVGIGLSTIGMIAAAIGYLTPIQGALLQEVIDVAVILNALRVLRDQTVA